MISLSALPWTRQQGALVIDTQSPRFGDSLGKLGLILLAAVAVAAAVPSHVAAAASTQAEARIDGLVTDTRGMPLEGAKVTVRLEDGGSRMSVTAAPAGDRTQINENTARNAFNEHTTDAEGKFRQSGLRVKERYVVTVELEGYVTFEMRRNLRPAVNPFNIALREAGGNVGGEAFQAGRAAYEADDFENAVKHMNEAVGVLSAQQNREDILSNALAVLGQSLLRLRRTDEAEESMLRLLEVDNLSTFGHQVLGQLYAQKGALPEASHHLAAYIELNPESASGHFMYGTVQQALGNTEAAATAYKRSLDIEPEGASSAQAKAALQQLVRGH